jgi:hypothetical protein
MEGILWATALKDMATMAICTTVDHQLANVDAPQSLHIFGSAGKNARNGISQNPLTDGGSKSKVIEDLKIWNPRTGGDHQNHHIVEEIQGMLHTVVLRRHQNPNTDPEVLLYHRRHPEGERHLRHHLAVPFDGTTGITQTT